jgi:hypothetical protein
VPFREFVPIVTENGDPVAGFVADLLAWRIRRY